MSSAHPLTCSQLQESREQVHGLNPMLNENVLVPFFEAISFSCTTFKNFRLVCKSWLTASTPRWRRCAWLKVKDKSFPGENTHISMKAIQKMLTTSGNPHQFLGDHPFRRYKLLLTKGLILIDEYLCQDARLEFWTKLGPHITHLQICKTKIYSAKGLRRVLLDMTPNLRFLSFESNPFLDPISAPLPLTHLEWTGRVDAPWRDEWALSDSHLQKNLTTIELRLGCGSSGFDFPIAWVYFLARFPNVKSLKLREMSQWCRRGPYSNELKLFLNSILRIREQCDPSFWGNLQELDILHENLSVGKFGTYDWLLTSLQSLTFPLRSLAMDIGFLQTEDGFKEILRPYTNTLEELLFYRGPCCPPFRIDVYDGQFPFGVELNRLTELRLIGTICKNLNFLKDIPNLRVIVLLDLAGNHEMEREVLHLYVDFWKDRLQDKVGRNHTVYGEVHKVIASTNFSGDDLNNCVLPKMEEFIIGHELCNGDQIKQLGSLMPNLRKIRLGLDNSGFLSLCQIWGQLQHLDVEPFEIDEAGILGIVAGQKYNNPCITDLKYLKLFRMGAKSIGVGTRDSARLIKAISKGLLATDGVKDLYFTAFNLKNYKNLYGRYITSPLQIIPNFDDGFKNMKL